jgi:hypothetical protein
VTLRPLNFRPRFVMEKYSQFRDKGTHTSHAHVHMPRLYVLELQKLTATGTAIAPFLPVPPAPSSILWTPVSVFLVACRLPLLITVSIAYFCFLEWFPVGHAVKYIALWLMAGIPGVWWVDLQIDGVRRGYVTYST